MMLGIGLQIARHKLLFHKSLRRFLDVHTRLLRYNARGLLWRSYDRSVLAGSRGKDASDLPVTSAIQWLSGKFGLW
jgi:hypothetical protein